MSEELDSSPAGRSGAVLAPDTDAERVRRALEELEGTKARLEREGVRERAKVRSQLVAELMPVLDDLDRTLDAGDETTISALRDGVRMVRDRLESVLLGYGVARVDALRKRFDPRTHQAVAIVGVDDPVLDGIVFEQWQPGYTFEGQLLRPARVVVGRLRT